MTIVGDNGNGRPLASDYFGGKHWPFVKLATGDEGVATPISATNPLPITGSISASNPSVGTSGAAEPTSATLVGGSDGTNLVPLSVTATGALNVASAPVQAYSFYPGFTPPPPAGTDRSDSYDEYGAKYVRGGVTTDEGSVRVGYSGAALARALGSCTFTNGSASVTGSAFTTLDPQPLVGDYIKLTADTEASYRRIYSIDSDTAITLDGNYTGTGGTGATNLASMMPTTTGTGATITVASGAVTIACNTTAAQTIKLLREVDYGPLIGQTNFTVSQRIANQTIYRGFTQPSGARRYGANFRIDGTTNTTVICETGWSFTAPATSTDLQSTTVTLPNGLTTAVAADYRIEVRGEVVSFYIAGVQVATHTLVLPRPYDVMSWGTIVVNGTTPASNTNVVINYDLISNVDSLRVSIVNNTDNILAAQSPAQLFNYSVAGVIVINTDLLVIDCLQLRALSIQCASMGATGVATVAWCNEPTFTVPVTATLYSEAGATSTTFNAAVLRVVNVAARYCRIRLTTATTAGTTTLNVQGFQSTLAPPIATQPISGTVTASATVGPAAHDAAISGNPLRMATRALTANYTAVATGDVADQISTLVGAKIIKPFSIPEVEFVGIDDITASTTAKQIKNATASNQNYVTGVAIGSDTLGAAGDLQLRSTPVASTTATIASNTLVMAATYNWKVGDLVYPTVSTVTGLTAGTYYYILTVSAANLTFSATRGGSTLAISGVSVAATLAKVLFRHRMQTASLPLTSVRFNDPIGGGTNLAIEVCTPVSLTSGRVDFNVHGYVAP